jgi:hypothetical protein
MELIEVQSLIWGQKEKLYIIDENVKCILGILRFKSIQSIAQHEQYKTGALKRKRQVKQSGNILK